MQIEMQPSYSTEVSKGVNRFYAAPNAQSSIADFPTTGQIVDTTMKEMLLSLQTFLFANFSFLFHKISSDLHNMENRVQSDEAKMCECTETIKDLADAYDDTKEDHLWIKYKLADLEDWSRRNNVKLWGIPESVMQNELHNYARTLMSTILPNYSEINLTIDRIHFIPKSAHLADSVPRDVLMRIHYL